MMIHTIEEAISRLRYIQLDSDFPPNQIVHMILAGGHSQPLYDVLEGRFVSAVEFLCTRTRELSSYPINGGVIKEDSAGPFFSKGTRLFPANEKLNEFLGILAVAGLRFDTVRIVTEKGTTGALSDLADAAMQRFELKGDEESWSLMLFSIYPGVTSEWRNGKGEIQSVEKILEAALKRGYGEGTCFGTHLIEGISFAISRYCLEQDIEPSQLKGIWEQAYSYVMGAVNRMKQNQKDDGSIDRSWFRKGKFPLSALEWKEKLTDVSSGRIAPARAIVYPTGHALDALSSLALFLSSEKEWIASASYIVAQTIETQWVPLAKDVNALTHAIHALKLIGD
jgi:hypothetical protein